MQHSVIIDDFPYNSRHRTGLRTSPIGGLIEKAVQNRQGEIGAFLDMMLAQKDVLAEIPFSPDIERPYRPHWNNDQFPAFDAIALYTLLIKYNPRLYVECGSGNSTKFAAEAIKRHGLRTKIHSIDPYPRAEVEGLCEKAYRLPIEEMDLSFFDTLQHDDVFFIDSSHRSFPNSDVTVFFAEILPNLPMGMLYGIHDIHLPWDYPAHWAERFYNEQYLLCCYLLGGGGGDCIELPLTFLSMSPEIQQKLTPLWANGEVQGTLAGVSPWGGSFWMRKASQEGEIFAGEFT